MTNTEGNDPMKVKNFITKVKVGDSKPCIDEINT